MTKRGLEDQWDRLVNSHFEILNRDVQKMVAVDGVANDVLLTEIGWALSKSMFKDLVKGKEWW